MSEQIVEIIAGLNNKAALKQHIYRNAKTVFQEFLRGAKEIAETVRPRKNLSLLKTPPKYSWSNF